MDPSAAQSASSSGSVTLVEVIFTLLFCAWLFRMGLRNEKLRPLCFVGGAMFVGMCTIAYHAVTGK